MRLDFQGFLCLLNVSRLSFQNIVTRNLQTFAKLSVPSYFSTNCTVVLDKAMKYSWNLFGSMANYFTIFHHSNGVSVMFIPSIRLWFKHLSYKWSPNCLINMMASDHASKTQGWAATDCYIQEPHPLLVIKHFAVLAKKLLAHLHL